MAFLKSTSIACFKVAPQRLLRALALLGLMLTAIVTTAPSARAGYYYAWGTITGGSCIEVAIKRHDASYGASQYGYGFYETYPNGGCTIYSVNAWAARDGWALRTLPVTMTPTRSASMASASEIAHRKLA